MIKEDCFAHFKKNNKSQCNVFKEMNCENCSFYKLRKEIKNNPYYAYSYEDKKQFKKDKEKNHVKDDQIVRD